MKKNEKNKITQIQLFFFIIQTQIGVGFISLPFDMNKVAKQDGWISILLAGLLIELFFLIAFLLFKKYPNLNIYEIAIYLAKPLGGKIIISTYIAFFIAIDSLVLMKYYQTINAWILPHTPKFILLSLIAITSIYLAKENIVIIARFFELASIVICLIIFFTLYSIKDADFYYIMPIADSGFRPILNGSKEAIIAMLGFEMIFVISPNIIGSQKQHMKTFTYANLFVTLFYGVIVFVAFSVFNPDEIKMLPQPILCMVKAQTFRVFERTDILFICSWIVLAITSFVSYLYASSIGIKNLFSLKTHSKPCYYLATTCVIISILSRNRQQIDYFTKYVSLSSYIVVGFIPLLLLILSLFDKKSGEMN